MALARSLRPEPVATVDGLDVSFHPGGRFTQVRFVNEVCLAAADWPLFARPSHAVPSLFAVFVDPQAFSFRTFENLIPLDQHFAKQPLALELVDGKRLGTQGEGWSFSIRTSTETQRSFEALDALGLYAPPLDTSARGGQRFIFRSAPLADALTQAIRQAMPDGLEGPGKFVQVNPVFRCNRFEPGDGKFKRHLDNPYFDRDRKHISRFTVLLYLTGGKASPALQLGDAVCLESIEAMTCVVFDQQLEHEGSPFLDGRKVFLRSELIFEVDALAENAAAGVAFTKACYLTGESLTTPALAEYVNRRFNEAAAAHWGKPGSDSTPEPFVHRTFRGIHFVSNGHEFWFPRGALSLVECAALALLDYFNAKIGGSAFRAICQSEVIQSANKDWIEPLLSRHMTPPASPVLGRFEKAALFPAAPESDPDICCSFHYSDCHLHPSVIEHYQAAQRSAGEWLTAAPVVLMGQEILLDPTQFVVDENRIHVLSETKLNPVHFAACQNSMVSAGILVGVGESVELLQPLVPPILFDEVGNCVRLRLDFFQNSWGVELQSKSVPLPVLLEGLEDPHLWGAAPWDFAQRRLSGGLEACVVTGERWWENQPVVADHEGRALDVRSLTDPDLLYDLLGSDDLRVRVAAASNPNLSEDDLGRFLVPGDVQHEQPDFELKDENVAAWQNPATPLVMLQSPRTDYAASACLALIWLEHLHGVRKGAPRLFLEDRIETWCADSQAPENQLPGHRIVREFAIHLSTLFGRSSDE